MLFLNVPKVLNPSGVCNFIIIPSTWPRWQTRDKNFLHSLHYPGNRCQPFWFILNPVYKYGINVYLREHLIHLVPPVWTMDHHHSPQALRFSGLFIAFKLLREMMMTTLSFSHKENWMKMTCKNTPSICGKFIGNTFLISIYYSINGSMTIGQFHLCLYRGKLLARQFPANHWIYCTVHS